MLTIEKLQRFGADTGDGLSRCLDDEAFYLSLVEMAIADDHLSDLERALDADDLQQAFEYAHAMKGVYANIALTPLYTPISQLTELLRNRQPADYRSYLEEAKAQYRRLQEFGKE